MAIPLISVDRLTLGLEKPARLTIVDEASFSLEAGEIVGIVGESGSGKTMLARALMRLEPEPVRLLGGDIRYNGASLRDMPQKELRRIRGAEVGMVFQEPMTSLNPSMTVGRQLAEGLALHSRLSPAEQRQKVLDILERVSIKNGAALLDHYPHQFSGGMRQRIMLAAAMLLKPRLLIADEPTTALDALVQRDVLELMLSLARENGTAVLLISHDLPMVARYCDRVLVMERGRIVEQGQTAQLLAAPQHPYTEKLLAAMPARGAAREVPKAEPLVSVRDLVVDFAGSRQIFGRKPGKRALDAVSMAVYPGEVLAVVGASGSGKTTLGRTIAGLQPASAGTLTFEGRPIERGSPEYDDYRRNCQMVFQDPFGSLDPRMRVADLVGEALRLEPDLTAEARRERVMACLAEVGLSESFAGRFPHQLSGGQRQRVAIARAVVRNPKFVIADEAVSALDATVRAQILALIVSLQKRQGFSCLFISHDLGAVEQVADRVIVMKDGQIVEEGLRDQIFDHPQTDYTRALLSAIPVLDRSGNGARMRWRFEADGLHA